MQTLLNNSVFIGLTLVLAGVLCYIVNAKAHDADLSKAAGLLLATGLGFMGGAGHASIPTTNEGPKQ